MSSLDRSQHWQRISNFKDLKRGDIVTHAETGDSYVIISPGEDPVAVRNVHLSNVVEWRKYVGPK